MATNMQELDQALTRLLIDVLKEPILYFPKLFAKSSKTTDVSASQAIGTRKGLAVIESKLTHIVPCLDLVRQLTPELTDTLRNVWIQPGDRLSVRVYPKYTVVPLTRAVHSEKDSEDIFLSLYLQPALSILGFLKAKEKLREETSSRTYTNDEIMDYKELRDFDFKLYAASVSGAAHIADLGVYELCSEVKSALYLPIEIKTPVAFPRRLLSYVSPRICPATDSTPVYCTMEEADMKKIRGWAVQFIWPEDDQNFGNGASAKHSKVISQVWNQMVAHKQKFAILSCNDVHYCCYRKDLVTGHLYISPPYYPEDGLINIVTWILKAAGFIKRDINLPTVFDSWWKEIEIEKKMAPGVNMMTIPDQALERYNKRKSKTRR